MAVQMPTTQRSTPPQYQPTIEPAKSEQAFSVSKQPEAAAAKSTPPQDLGQVFEQISTTSSNYASAQADFAEQVAKGELKPGDGKFEAESRRLFDMMLGLQQISQSYSMRVELLSKVVEHATSSTKTLLQTQT